MPFSAHAQDKPPTTFSSPLESPQIGKKRPEVYISGKKVVSRSNVGGKLGISQLKNLPPELNGDQIRSAIEQRRHMRIYNHNPTQGVFDAPVTIVEFSDLSCLQCYKTLRKVDEVREKYMDKIKYVSVHLPIDYYNTSNPAAFYGRLAHQSGVYWEYRKLLINQDSLEENTFSEKLLEAGVDVRKLRTLIRKNARQFYRELDADALLARKMNEQRPPAVYVNGIRVGISIPYEKLEDLIKYEIAERAKEDAQ